MGWYHTVGFDHLESGEGAPACPIGGSAASGDTPPAQSSAAAISSNSTPSGNTACPLPPSSPPPPPPPDVESIYHLCQQSKWREAKARKVPYFPPTFVKDGKFTRASVSKDDLVSTANTYYKDTPGEWIVLEINCKTLYGLGIPILAQDAPESTPKEPVKCLQIFGGISTALPGLITKVYGMHRDAAGTFVGIFERPASKKKAQEEDKKQEAPKNRSPEQAKPMSGEKPKQKARRFWPQFSK